LGRKKRDGWFRWDEATEASGQGLKGFVMKRKSGKGRGNSSTITEPEESSEERSPGVLGAERGFRGMLNEAIEWVAKPEGGTFKEQGKGFLDMDSKGFMRG